ncbi:nucleotidyltransferase family protein [Youhaiella tibetensis]|uniref:Nucleotidyltransferase family protein n=1 Tax=Paradevosia tibetensis TaxID=1447062 RepID=A0A5B9DSH2_9HYPH|nr:nucleotidyltransferase family protein [Youhaiella tibetensis]QEE22106.1 nucleotidyltransferase family protein [Youhaiella tibetensis]
MNEHLRFSGRDFETQRQQLEAIIRGQPSLMAALEGLDEMALPDSWIVSGAIYNNVWNALTGRPSMTGVKDIDLFYFDASDLSYEAEDRVIRDGAERFARLPVPVEIRNQARVHLWYERHFGRPYAPLASSREAIDRFACLTHAVGVRLIGDGRMEIYAPYGLDDMFSFRLVPNRKLDNRETHETKGARAVSIWPEVTVVPW